MPYAMVLDALPTRTTGNCVFIAYVGSQIFDFLDVEDARDWIRKGMRGKGFCTYLSHGDEHERWKGILQNGPQFDYRIEIKVPREFWEEGIAVHVFKRHHLRSLLHISVSPMFFLEEGFDLDGENIQNVGLVLSPVISAYLYALLCQVHGTPVPAPTPAKSKVLEIA